MRTLKRLYHMKFDDYRLYQSTAIERSDVKALFADINVCKEL